MKLKKIVEQIDSVCADATPQLLHHFIRSYVLSIPEPNRESFLKQLSLACSNSNKLISTKESDRLIVKSILDEFSSLEDFFSQLKKDSIFLETRNLDSFYDDDEDDYDGEEDEYDDDEDDFDDDEYEDDDADEETYDTDEDDDCDADDENDRDENCNIYTSLSCVFTDNFNIKNNICRCLEIVHKCSELELYQEGYKLAKKLYAIKVKIKGESFLHNQSDTLSLWELHEQKLISDDKLRLFCEEYLSFLYFCTEGEKRISLVLELLFNVENYLNCDVLEPLSFSTLKNDGSSDLKRLDSFLIDLIAAIAKKGSESDIYLYVNELLPLISSPKQQKELILSQASSNPDLLRDYVASVIEDKPEAALDLILSVPKISSNTLEKFELLDLGILAASHFKKQQALEDLCLELFTCMPSLTNYLKLRYYSENYHKYDHKIQDILKQNNPQKNGASSKFGYQLFFFEDSFLLEPSPESYYFICLIEGRFDEFFENIQKTDFKKGPAYDFGNNVFYKGLLLCALLLAGKHDENMDEKTAKSKALGKPSHKFIKKDLAEMFSLVLYFDYLDLSKLENLKIYAEIPSEKLISLWFENTVLSADDTVSLLRDFSSNVTDMIDTVLEANRTSLFPAIAEWIKVLSEIYTYYGEEQRLVELQDLILTKYSGKKTLINLLKKKGINLEHSLGEVLNNVHRV